MTQILRSKNLATKFQILIEVATNQPNVQQRDIAKKLGVTPQAVSEYMGKLMEEGSLVSEGRSKYRVTRKGADWILKMLRDLQSYSAFAGKAITGMSVCAAVADFVSLFYHW